jgi:hypothetical protein
VRFLMIANCKLPNPVSLHRAGGLSFCPSCRIAAPIRGKVKVQGRRLRCGPEKEMIVAEMRSTDMPMEILGLEVKGKDIGKERIERAGDVASGQGVY